MNDIVDEIRSAYAPWGIEVEGVATYGTYYRLRCARCGAQLGAVGDKLLPGIARQIVDVVKEMGKFTPVNVCLAIKDGVKRGEQLKDMILVPTYSCT